MTPEQQSAIACLADRGQLTDPKYRLDQSHAEKLLKAQCKACWQHKDSFPGWVKEYCKKWTLEREAKFKSAFRTYLDDGTGQGLPGGQGPAPVS